MIDIASTWIAALVPAALGIAAIVCSQLASKQEQLGEPPDWPTDGSEHWGDDRAVPYLDAQQRHGHRVRRNGLQTMVNLFLAAATISAPMAVIPPAAVRFTAPLTILVLAVVGGVRIRAKYRHAGHLEDAWGVYLAYDGGRARFGETPEQHVERFTIDYPFEAKILKRARRIGQPLPEPELLAPN